MDNNTETYWVTAEPTELVASLEKRIDAYYRWVMASGRRQLWAAAFTQYNAALWNGPDINRSGAESEYSLLSVNQTRNILKHLMNLTISQRPAFEPKATNTDSKSQKQTVIAASLLTYYSREKHMERKIRAALEFASLYGEGFVAATWAPDSGEIVGTNPETNIAVREGDMFYEAFEPMDVVRDVSLTTAANSSWWITKCFRNRWDLVARFPEHRDAILAANPRRDPLRNFTMSRAVIESNNTDLIEVWEFYHDRTPACPDGKYCMFLYGNGALLASELPYHNVPVFRLSADDIGGESFGYGSIFDLLNIQQAVDAAYSSIQTNQSTFGVQSISAPKGSNLTSTQVSGGLNLLEYNNTTGGGKPEVLQLLSTAPELFNHLSKLERVMETIGGINSVVRGEAPGAGMSGAAMALLQSSAVQFVQGLQSSYVQLLEDLGTATIATLRDYATTKRVVAIVGKSQRSNLQEFTGDDLSTINRVLVDVGNPLTRTTAGKLQIADTLLQNKLISTPQEYLGVIETGNLQTLTEGPMNELLSIRAENEALTDGKPLEAMITDNHALHLSEHKCLVNDPSVRQDVERLNAALEHMKQHWALWSDPANAGFLTALGQTPAAPSAPQGAPTGAGVAAVGAPEAVVGDTNGMAEGMLPGMPGMPTPAGQ
jgi:hypothetical protein